MKYVSIDIETTGLRTVEDQVIEFAAIIEDTSFPKPLNCLPQYRALILHPSIVGQPYALSMHPKLFLEMSDALKMTEEERDEKNYLYPEEVGESFSFWLKRNNFEGHPVKITAAGKNFGTFDLQFINNLPDFKKWVNIRQRVLDPAPLYLDIKTDSELPNLSKCKERAGITDTTIAHTGIEDAWDVIQVLRKKL
jgi:oligoribonuclease